MRVYAGHAGVAGLVWAGSSRRGLRRRCTRSTSCATSSSTPPSPRRSPPSRLGPPPPLAPLPPWPPSRLGRRRPRGGPSSATMAATTRPAARARSTVPGPCGGEADPPRRGWAPLPPSQTLSCPYLFMVLRGGEADPPRRGGAPQLLMYGPARRLALPRRGWAPLPPRSAAQATAGRRGEAAHAAAVGRWGGGRSVAMRRWGGGAVGR